MSGYDHKKIEQKWQKEWVSSGAFEASDDHSKPKYYPLIEFPYPSGAGLHVGHPRPYIALDIIARKRRAEGYNVLYPIGWDAFGLPTENFAIKTGRHPREITKENTDTFRKQIQRLGISFDWSREINTTDPGYYKWTQWIFLELFKHGLAYKAKTTINWCPKCKIGLANEEVVDGSCERCGSAVEKREKEQWMLAITKYAKRLYDDLDTVDYIERAKTQQRNWIGPSEGALINFRINREGQQRPNFLLIHGFGGSPQGSFFPWLKKKLEDEGFYVQVPELPSTEEPKESEQVGYVLENCTIDEDTVIVGHSLGCVVARRVLANHGKPVRGLVQIASAVGPEGPERPFHKQFSWEEDFEMLSKLAHYSIVVADTREQWRLPYLQSLADHIQRPLRKDEARKEHFTGEEEPALLRYIFPSLTVFTTRPDTLYGATYMVLAPELPQVTHMAITNREEVDDYIAKTRLKTDIERTAEGQEKTGVKLKGVHALNPATGEEIPIYIADYVLAHYGTGAIMAVPAHDERDFAFAKKFDIAIRKVIEGGEKGAPYTGEGPLVHSKEFDGMESAEAKLAITQAVHGRTVTTYKLRDWVFSRQRYWGEPIPMVFCSHQGSTLMDSSRSNLDEKGCGWVPVPLDALPVMLPEVEKYEPTDTGESPLANIEEFVNTSCPKCGGPAKRETDVMPNWAGSSWYYLRYADPHNEDTFASEAALKYWTPVDWYNGGMEHTVLHLLYSRFWHKFLFDIGVVPTSEPYKKRTSHGLILAEEGEKMSKSKGNVVNPDEMVERFGADSLRTYEMFMGPFDQAIAWSTDGLVGVRRFLERVLVLSERVEDAPVGDLEYLMHQTIKKVSDDIESLKLNTAVSALMIFSNEIQKQEVVPKAAFDVLLRLLAPFAPHITEEIWSVCGGAGSIHAVAWPTYDEKKLKSDRVTITVQVNGKTRGTFEAERGMDEKEALNKAMELPLVVKWLDKKTPKRLIYIPERLLNIVV